jgi:hypothetical protein
LVVLVDAPDDAEVLVVVELDAEVLVVVELDGTVEAGTEEVGVGLAGATTVPSGFEATYCVTARVPGGFGSGVPFGTKPIVTSSPLRKRTDLRAVAETTLPRDETDLHTSAVTWPADPEQRFFPATYVRDGPSFGRVVVVVVVGGAVVVVVVELLADLPTFDFDVVVVVVAAEVVVVVVVLVVVVVEVVDFCGTPGITSAFVLTEIPSAVR